MTHCLSTGPIQLNCPKDHWIYIVKAKVFKGRGPAGQCPYVHDMTSCPVKDIQQMIQSSAGCAVKNTCSYYVPNLDDSMCNPAIHQGAAYVHLEYQCQGVFQ